MTVVEIKSQIFDLLKELETLQTKANEIVKQKNDLLKQLMELEKVDVQQ